MSASSRRTFSSDFKQFFLRGLVILLPSVLTLWILVKAYEFIDDKFAEPINERIVEGMIYTAAVWDPLGIGTAGSCSLSTDRESTPHGPGATNVPWGVPGVPRPSPNGGSPGLFTCLRR